MTLDAHVTGIWCGQIGGGVGIVIDLRRLSGFWDPKESNDRLTGNQLR